MSVAAVRPHTTAPDALKGRSGLDPRVVLAHILVLGVLTTLVDTPEATATLLVCTSVIVAVVCGLRQGLTMVLVFLVSWLLRWLILEHATGTPATLLVPVLVVLIRMAPLMGAYFLFTGALTVSRFVAALESMRAPRMLTVPLAVMLRFVPTIGFEMRQIRDALRTRGVPLTPWTILRAPLSTAELVIVPLAQRCLSVAEELSASAVTRGLDGPVRRTSRVPVRWRATDTIYAVVVASTSALVVAVDRLVLA